MIRLGVTGGIGSGKSTVCRLLEARGAVVFYADPEARQLMERDAGLRAAIAEQFGADSYDAEGRLNRSWLSARLFADEEAVSRMNALVHPRVYSAFQHFCQQHAASALVVLESALLIESGGTAHVDYVAVVETAPHLRVQRVAQRDGLSEDAIRARMQRQLPPEEMRRRADFVLQNDGDPDALRIAVDGMLARLHLRPPGGA